MERLNRARAGLEQAANSVRADFWRVSPGRQAWSAAEVIAHLEIVETRITNGAAKLVSGPPPPVPFLKKLHAPPWVVRVRAIRAKTPTPLDPSLLAGKDEMLSRLTNLRQRTLALLEENRSRQLSAYRWPHPFFGSLNFYQWFEMIAYHEVRHAKQIREIVKSSQK